MEANFRVGQYVLERPLGEGGMAEVWLGRNIHLGTPAAIKFLSQAYAGVADIEKRFLNEGRRQGSLNHPNIIKVYGFEYVENRSFLILQFIGGESLDDLLRRSGRLEPAEASRIAISVCNALDCAHEHSIVHRDIKPSNILLDENRTPYLGDFGIVLATNEKRITRTGTAMGTALYMSPEQIKEPSTVDRRSDVYSFGCVLYEMLTGEPPFNPDSGGQGDTDFTIKLAHVQQAPPPLRQKNPALSPEMEAVVMRCLAKSPAERYGTCRELRDALSAAMVGRSFAQTAARSTPVPYQGPVARPAAPVTPFPSTRNTPPPLAPPVVPPVAPYQPYAPPHTPAPAMQYCPNCRRPIAAGLMQCPFCSIRLAHGFGAVPAIGPGNLNNTASSARTCGILSLVFTVGAGVVASALSSYDRRQMRTFLGLVVIAGIVLAILAIVKGNGAKRVLANYPLDPVLRSRANAGISMGWITVGVVFFSIVLYSAR
jgi:serine/threonine protein kinase